MNSKKTRFIPAITLGLIYGICVIGTPILVTLQLSLAEEERQTNLIFLLSSILFGGMILWLRFGFFAPQQLKQRFALTPKTKLYKPSVVFVWIWMSLISSSELTLISYCDLLPKQTTIIIEIIAHLITFAQLFSFAKLSPTPRFLSFSCLVVCSIRIIEAPSLFISFLIGASLPWHAFISLLIPYFFTAIGLHHTLPPLKAWEYVFVQQIGNIEEEDVNDVGVSKIKRSSTTVPKRIPTLTFTRIPGNMQSQTNEMVKIVQITDAHLGPVTTPEDIRNFCEEVVENVKPDLVLITGDMLTTERYSKAQKDLEFALSPLRRLERGHVFACLGNHDHEALEEVMTAFKNVGVKVLMDETATLDIRGKHVIVCGINYRSYLLPSTGDIVHQICHNAFSKVPNQSIRIVLLHDPSAFQFVPDESKAVVLSGHTHGGVVGIIGKISLTTLAGIPDNGLWRKGSNILYVHRGQGSRSLLGNVMVRLFIPSEKSILWLSSSSNNLD